jgi:hypothetical protein
MKSIGRVLFLGFMFVSIVSSRGIAMNELNDNNENVYISSLNAFAGYFGNISLETVTEEQAREILVKCSLKSGEIKEKNGMQGVLTDKRFLSGAIRSVLGKDIKNSNFDNLLDMLYVFIGKQIDFDFFIKNILSSLD